MIRLAIGLFLLALPAAAQDLPAFHNVTNVAVNDVLNIRNEPNASAPILDTLPPNAQDIEVVRLSENGRWGLVNVYDRAGWTAMAFLTPQPQTTFTEQKLTCFGTEPFWSADIGNRLTYSPMDGQGFDHAITARTRSINRSDRYALTGGGETAIIERRACSDGMSDAAFGLSINLLLSSSGTHSLLSGCCRLSH